MGSDYYWEVVIRVAMANGVTSKLFRNPTKRSRINEHAYAFSLILKACSLVESFTFQENLILRMLAFYRPL